MALEIDPKCFHAILRVRAQTTPQKPKRKANQMATTDAKNDTWTTAEDESWGQEVESESQIVLETEGEGFIGDLTGIDPPNSNGIVQAHFENVTDLGDAFLGDSMFMNLTRDLINKLKKVPVNSRVRLQWTSSMNTGQKTPMRVFKVQWR